MRFLRTALTPVLAVAAVGLAACAPDSGKIGITYINPTAAATVTRVPQPTDTPRPQATITPIPPRPTDTPRSNPTATPTRPAAGEFRAASLKTPQQLYDDLLATQFTSNELGSVPGLKIKGLSKSTLAPDAKALGAIGQVNAAFSEPGSMFGDLDRIFIAFVVYGNETAAIASLNPLPPSITSVPNPPGGPIIVHESGILAITRYGNVTILANEMGSGGDKRAQQQRIVNLVRAGVSHLQGVLSR